MKTIARLAAAVAVAAVGIGTFTYDGLAGVVICNWTSSGWTDPWTNKPCGDGTTYLQGSGGGHDAYAPWNWQKYVSATLEEATNVPGGYYPIARIHGRDSSANIICEVTDGSADGTSVMTDPTSTGCNNGVTTKFFLATVLNN
jgi:hypothetical protein